jgi:HSP90 family molecular chaperone
MQELSTRSRVLEYNPHHQLILKLAERVAIDHNDTLAALAAHALYETALLESGYPPHSRQRFSTMVRTA